MLLVPLASAATLQVGSDKPYATPCAAAAVAADGDTVEIDAGTYTGDVCAWTSSNLTIRGVGGYAKLDADGQSSGGKAIWVIQGDDTTVEWIEFTGATVPDQNGAGIRQEGTNLTVDHCWFHDNEDGILAGDDAASTIIVTHSIFDHNGYGDGQSHNLYINHVAMLYFAFNWSHHSNVGHQLKSRAYETWVLYNVLEDGDGGNGSYQVDLANGGFSVVLGNVLQQSPEAENGGMLSYGAEGITNDSEALYVVNNTFVNDRGSGTFVRNAGGTNAQVWNNVFAGGGTAIDGLADLLTNYEGDPGFLDAATGDYSLVEGSVAIDAATPPGSIEEESLSPEWMPGREGETPRSIVGGALDIGAFEWGVPAEDSGGDTAAGDDTGYPVDLVGKEPGACGCGGGGAAGIVAPLLLALRRR